MEFTEVVDTEVENEVLSEYEKERGKPMPNLTHGSLQANFIIQFALNYGLNYRIASEVALATIPNSTTPDVVLYPNRDLNFKNEVAKQEEPPLLVIEIQSPSQTNEEMIEKLTQYFDFGVKSCWIVFPSFKGVSIYSNPNHYDFYHDEDLLKDKTLGIEIDLKKIFI